MKNLDKEFELYEKELNTNNSLSQRKRNKYQQ
ncbi:Uncharacterised protein [Chlamydia trachomatis]|nr:Uncharacterised protein [Chlamydia trachomatis]CRH46670.1 Uncharacterised protein [Chlamydia trachomatis]CRH55274.1 Uncharacterised protein [Chlamydia trachomatis]